MLRLRKIRYAFLLAVLLGAGFFFHEIKAKAENVSTKNLREAWTVIQEGLGDRDSTVREQAVKGLRFVPGERAEEALRKALLDDSDYVRIWAAHSLALKGSSAGKSPLLAILSNSYQAPANEQGPLAALSKMKALAKGRMRGEAAKTLGLLKDRDLIPTLKLYKRDGDGRVRDGAAVALALLGDSSEAIVFASALKDQDRGVRLAAVEALSAIKDPRMMEPVRGILSDPEEDIRATAVKALGAMKASEMAESVKRLLLDPSGLVRLNAAWALGEIGAVGTVPALKGALSDESMMIRIAAAESLGKMGDPSGLPVFEEAFGSNDIEAKVRAVEAIGSVRTREAQGLAVKLLSDGNIKVRLGAAVALFQLNG